MLSKDDVDQMVRDAQEHAEEDRKRREEVETRNQADALAFQAERTLRDLGDKVASEDKADVETKVTALREALKGNDLDAVRSRMSELAESLQKVGTAAYQSAPPVAPRTAPAPTPTTAAAPVTAPEGAADGEEEAVEGEFKEV